VFTELIASGRFQPGTMLVPGCGSGHDAVAFARAGFRVTGVDFAPEALAEARALAEQTGVAVDLVGADIFTLGDAYAAAFDYVVEYVTYCAIDPGRRGEYAAALGRVLRPGGLLIALFFPVENRAGGPPFGVEMEEVERVFFPWFTLTHQEQPSASIKPRRNREVLTFWKRRP
jgi:SAM-dependent methyltransferase